MTESICGIFLTAFLFGYLALFLVLLGWTIHGAVDGRLKRPRVVKMPEGRKQLAFASPSQKRKTKSQFAPG